MRSQHWSSRLGETCSHFRWEASGESWPGGALLCKATPEAVEVAALGWAGLAGLCCFVLFCAGMAGKGQGWLCCALLGWLGWPALPALCCVCSAVLRSAVLGRLGWLGWMGRAGPGSAGLPVWAGMGWADWLGCAGLAGASVVCVWIVHRLYGSHRGGVPSCAIAALDFSTWRDLLAFQVGSLRRKLAWGCTSLHSYS